MISYFVLLALLGMSALAAAAAETMPTTITAKMTKPVMAPAATPPPLRKDDKSKGRKLLGESESKGDDDESTENKGNDDDTSPEDNDGGSDTDDDAPSGSLYLKLVGGNYTGTVEIESIEDFTTAHIHLGNKTSNGPVVVWAYPFNATGLEMKVPALSGSLSFNLNFYASLLDPMIVKEEGYYFNVHTVMFPSGEIRGQLIPGK